jgi:hypothetical protein
MYQFAVLRFADHIFWRFADPVIVCGLKASANPQINNFFPCKYKLKLLAFQFIDDLCHFVVSNILILLR